MRKRLTLAAIESLEHRAAASTGERHVTVYGFVSSKTKQLTKAIKRVNGEWVETDEPPTDVSGGKA